MPCPSSFYRALRAAWVVETIVPDSSLHHDQTPPRVTPPLFGRPAQDDDMAASYSLSVSSYPHCHSVCRTTLPTSSSASTAFPPDMCTFFSRARLNRPVGPATLSPARQHVPAALIGPQNLHAVAAAAAALSAPTHIASPAAHHPRTASHSKSAHTTAPTLADRHSISIRPFPILAGSARRGRRTGLLRRLDRARIGGFLRGRVRV